MIRSPAGPARAAALLFALAAVMFAVSGAAGLIYQVVWTRKLVLLFGTASYAVSTVLGVFFLGLGAGGLIGGRMADRGAPPLRTYAIIEVLIAAWGLIVIAALGWGGDAIAALLRAAGGGRVAGTAMRAALAGALLLPPTLLMGATLPLLAKHVERHAAAHGLRAGLLYAANTLGAVAGCFAAGFALLPALGYTRTTFVAMAANLLAAGIAMLLAARRRAPEPAGPDAAAPAVGAPAHGAAAGRFALAALAWTGFCGIAFEVLWTRLLAIVLLGTTYAYTTMLGALLLGIALGGAAGALVAARARRPLYALGVLLGLYAAAALFALHQFAALPAQMAAVARLAGNDWDAGLRATVWLCMQAILLPAFFSGAAFPVAIRIAGGWWASLGRDIGRLYAVNTFGGVIGAAAGGYLLIPLIGTHSALVALALSLLIAGIALILAAPGLHAATRAAASAACAALALGAWSAAPADVNAALNAGYIPEDHRVLHVREGTEGTVVVSEPQHARDGAGRVLWINRVQATTSIERGVKMNRFQGVLPLLFDRDPRSVLFMCFGSGITCGTLALTPFDRIDAIEISPDVIDAAPFFDKDNLGVLGRPNLHIHIDDGRNYLLTTPRTYDAITFEPMPLALAGVSAFYTREYYEACRARLNPGGLVSQWVPLHSLDTAVVRSLAATFAGVFPECTGWFVNADLFLIGSDRPLRIDYARLHARLAEPAVRTALAASGYPDLESVAASFLLDKAGVAAFAAGAPVMRDDRPWAEFEAPKLVYAGEVPASIRALAPHAARLLDHVDGGSEAQRAALDRRHRSLLHDLAGLQAYYGGFGIGSEALDAFAASLEIDPANANAQYYLKQIALHQGERFLAWEQPADAARVLDTALRYLPHDPALAALRARVPQEPPRDGAPAPQPNLASPYGSALK